MAYATGTANTLADLLTAIQNACTANGWTLSGSVINKGSCFTDLSVSGSDLLVQGGTGIDGSNALTTPGPKTAHIGATHVPAALVFPVTYNIHVLTAPDEVYVLVNHSTSYWQWLAFGISPVAGLPGTGGWYAASSSSEVNTNAIVITPTQACGYGGGGATSAGLFAQSSLWVAGYSVASFIHTGLDGNEWSGTSPLGGGAGNVDAWTTVQPFMARQPNAWNGEIALFRIQPILARASSKYSMVADIGHARYCRNDNYADGDLITLGSDQWKVYPFARKNSAARDGNTNGGTLDSGTFAMAVRYVP